MLVKGVVIDNNDPQKVGRLRIRIPHLHGVDPNASNYMSDGSLPWCYPCIPWFASYNAGSFIVPEIGSYMWLEEVAGNPSYYVYIGGSYGIGPSSSKPFGSLDPSSPDYRSGPAGELETPKEALTNYGKEGVIFKTPKGSVISYSDVKDSENLKIISPDKTSVIEIKNGVVTITSGKIILKSTDSEVVI